MTAESLFKCSWPGCMEALDIISAINSFLKIHTPITDDSVYVQNLLQMIKSIFEMICNKKTEDLLSFCNTDQVFISTWGMGTHNVIFQNS